MEFEHAVDTKNGERKVIGYVYKCRNCGKEFSGIAFVSAPRAIDYHECSEAEHGIADPIRMDIEPKTVDLEPKGNK